MPGPTQYARPRLQPANYSRQIARRSQLARKKRLMSPGMVRTTGFYGRFSGSSTEKKFFRSTVEATSSTLAAAGTVTATSLNLVDQGNAEDEMVGRKIVIKKISVNMEINCVEQQGPTLGDVQSGISYRVALVLDKQCNGAAATVQQIYETTNIQTFINMENSQRFQVLKQWKGTFNPPMVVYYDTPATNPAYAVGNAARWIQWTNRVNIPIEFSPMAGGSRALSEVRSNNLLIVGFSDNGLARVFGAVRIRYEDA